ncbi:hypothetical protein QQ045_022820 [Rhodiola kirilowii]
MAFKGFGYKKGVRKKQFVAFREPLVLMESVECGSDVSSMEIAMAQVSSGQLLPQQDPVSETSLLSTETISEEFVRIDMPPSPNPTPEKMNLFGSTSELSVGSSSNSENSSRGLPPEPKDSGSLNMEEAAILSLGGLQFTPSENSSFLRSRSLTRQMERSMPASPIALNSNGVGEQQTIFRSCSVPETYTDETIRENRGRVLRVVPNRRMAGRDRTLSSASLITNGEEDQDDITEEEAVCRICFEEFGEELKTFKLECNCRGDLALVHRECSQRWFDLRGNRTCEICRAEVQNIIVTVSRRPAVENGSLNQLQLQQPPPLPTINTAIEATIDATTDTTNNETTDATIDNRIWHELPVLAVGSVVGYFMCMKLIQISQGGDKDYTGIYGISFSCFLGLLTSFLAAIFGQREHVWIYALAQFVIFTVFTQFFFLFHLEPIVAIPLAIVLAIGISSGAHPVYRAIKKLREDWRNDQLNNNPQSDAPPTEGTAESHHSDVNRYVSNE